MVRPRAFSSASRSVSTPVRARTNEVLPWSTWPAKVMIMTSYSSQFDALQRVNQFWHRLRAAHIQEHLIVFDATDNGWLRGSQPIDQFLCAQ